MKLAPRMMSRPPMIVDGITMTSTAVRGPNSSVSNPESRAPPVAPMKKM